ncbi:MAG TPA: bifunctional 5,10-methylenetetrahydrofolate dehydrogenase/5,10-methenyltetrahydrofolate cyclohydrolase [Streptosporangiaceae bacterium]|jgi:methylenetetrahydrofolate dehydrogenase (NADP+)/methenyltetrahydrofolate cyclohydrolase
MSTPPGARRIDGRAIAARLRAQAAEVASALRERGVQPLLAVADPTAGDEGAAWYMRSISRAAEQTGIGCQIHPVDPAGRQEAVTSLLTRLSGDPAVHGIICQAPLPPGLTAAAAGACIAVAKDVDGANPASLGQLAAGLGGAFAPATAAAVIEILRAEGVPLEGRRAVVVGRSTVVGKPVALLLLAENATVTVCHSRTAGLAAVCREADVLVAAAGRPGLIGAAHVAPGAVVIDVGITATPGGVMAGDVDEAAVTPAAAALTPVPGGVGPVTTAQLLRQTAAAAWRAETSRIQS